jgi:poly(A) polymerase
LPFYVKEALQKLDEAGHIAYLVGGCVRDFLLRQPSKDHDIATSADPDELCRLFPNAVTVGKSFGVIKVPIELEGGSEKQIMLEIATFRQDLEYRDHRHPTGVLFSGPAEDAKRRDFSINALFFDPKTRRILDTVEGYSDLDAKTIRAIGDPVRRFEEDHLRMLRAIRFAARFGFTIEPATMAAMRSLHASILRVSPERIRDELVRIYSATPIPDGTLTKDEIERLQ